MNCTFEGLSVYIGITKMCRVEVGSNAGRAQMDFSIIKMYMCFKTCLKRSVKI